MRRFTTGEKVNEIFRALGPDASEELWLISAHTSDQEFDKLFSALDSQYAIDEALEAPGAGVYLLRGS